MIENRSNGNPSRRGFLSLCVVGSAHAGIGACAPVTTVGDTSGWEIATNLPGNFFDLFAMSMLSDVADLMVGDGVRPSARDVGVLDHIDGMIDGWAGRILKARLTRLPGQIDQFTAEQYGRSYAVLPRETRVKALAEYDTLAFADRTAEASVAYRTFKSLMLKVYLTSQELNRDFVRNPGQYLGDLSIDEHQALSRERTVSFSG